MLLLSFPLFCICIDTLRPCMLFHLYLLQDPWTDLHHRRRAEQQQCRGRLCSAGQPSPGGCGCQAADTADLARARLGLAASPASSRSCRTNGVAPSRERSRRRSFVPEAQRSQSWASQEAGRCSCNDWQGKLAQEQEQDGWPRPSSEEGQGQRQRQRKVVQGQECFAERPRQSREAGSPRLAWTAKVPPCLGGRLYPEELCFSHVQASRNVGKAARLLGAARGRVPARGPQRGHSAVEEEERLLRQPCGARKRCTK